MSDGWRQNLVTQDVDVRKIARDAKRVAVLGIKTDNHVGQPAYEVPAYLAAAGVEVVPVPVYYPDVTTILGRQVYRRVRDVPGGQLDIVDVFRLPKDLAQHLDDLIAARPACVWLQSGITDAEFEEALARAGIKVVADRCLMVDHRAATSAAL